MGYEQAEELLDEANGHAGYAIRLIDPLLPNDDPEGLVSTRLLWITAQSAAAGNISELRVLYLSQHALFDSIDEDGSGTLERDEIDKLAKEMDTPLTDRELDVAMATMDADGSGEVDFEEFSDWYLLMRKKGRMPSWGRAISELQRRGGRKKDKKLTRSLSSDAAADQRSAMAMRGR